MSHGSLVAGVRSPLIGRRLPDATMDAPGPGWEAWERRQPGDYMRVDFGNERVGWYVCDPHGRAGLVGLPRIEVEQVADLLVPVRQDPPVHDWEITEHEDATITVRPSIMNPTGWHGHLTRGVWEAVNA